MQKLALACRIDTAEVVCESPILGLYEININAHVVLVRFQRHPTFHGHGSIFKAPVGVVNYDIN